jgi:hypothetical protein
MEDKWNSLRIVSSGGVLIIQAFTSGISATMLVKANIRNKKFNKEHFFHLLHELGQMNGHRNWIRTYAYLRNAT